MTVKTDVLTLEIPNAQWKFGIESTTYLQTHALINGLWF